jgi:outer membrane protein OmpA-like peptidoglycan-associated protein
MESFYSEADEIFAREYTPPSDVRRSFSAESWGEVIGSAIPEAVEQQCQCPGKCSGEIDRSERYFESPGFGSFDESSAGAPQSEAAFEAAFEAASWTEQGLEYPEREEHEESTELAQYFGPDLEAPADCYKLRGDEPKFAIYPGATSDGIAEPFKTPDPTNYGVTLLDYKVNDYSLRAAHQQALQALIAKIAADERSGLFSASGGWQISIDGFASKTGNFEHNRTLSHWRAWVAARALECLAAQAGLPPNRVVVMDIVGKGYEDDALANVEDPRRRRIQVSVHPPVARQPEKPRSSDKFKVCIEQLDFKVYPLPLPKSIPPHIRIAAEILAYAKVTARYRIYDRELGSSALYAYAGKGVSIQLPVDRMIPKVVKDYIPKPLWDLLGKFLASITPGGRNPKRGCAEFDVNVHRVPDPKRDKPNVVEVRSFGGATDLVIPSPGLGGVQIGFKNSIFRNNAKAQYKPNPLEIDWPRKLAARAVILTEGTATRVTSTPAREASEEVSDEWTELPAFFTEATYSV